VHFSCRLFDNERRRDEHQTSRTVQLSTGVTVTVAPVPQKIYDVIRMKHPDPPVPVVEDDRTATGEPMRFENQEDPDYLRAKREVEQARQIEWAEASLLFGLPEVEVPEDWQPPIEELEYLTDGQWQPRQFEGGRKLDYIEWELLRVVADYQKVQRAINEMAMVSEEAADAVEATFRGDVEVPGEGPEAAGDPA
jgi:hypothetical protein